MCIFLWNNFMTREMWPSSDGRKADSYSIKTTNAAERRHVAAVPVSVIQSIQSFSCCHNEGMMRYN